MKVDYKGSANEDGVYSITNGVNGRVYYGSAKRFKSRFHSHYNALLASKHGNKFLQADFAKCGADAFTFQVVEIVTGGKEARLKREQHYIDLHFDHGVQCYNLRKQVWDTREGQGNTRAIDPATDGRCKPPSPEALAKRSVGLKKAFEANPELRAECSRRAKEVRWKGHSANIIVVHLATQEAVTIHGSLREWCLQRQLSYKAFHQLVKGKIKTSGGWALNPI